MSLCGSDFLTGVRFPYSAPPTGTAASVLVSANPATLIFMLYDEAIRSLQKAIDAVAEGDIEGRWRANNKAMEIIGELATNLDMEHGGQIAERLYQLYRFLLNYRRPESLVPIPLFQILLHSNRSL